jgi:hypothetical protein
MNIPLPDGMDENDVEAISVLFKTGDVLMLIPVGNVIPEMDEAEMEDELQGIIADSRKAGE